MKTPVGLVVRDPPAAQDEDSPRRPKESLQCESPSPSEAPSPQRRPRAATAAGALVPSAALTPSDFYGGQYSDCFWNIGVINGKSANIAYPHAGAHEA